MSADLLQRLADAGTPMHLIMEVAETLAEAKAAERLLEKRREKDRDRKRNSKDSAESSEIVESAETTPSLSPSPSFPPNPQTNPAPMPTPVCVSRARGGFHRMPEGWKPTKAYPEALQAKLDCWPPGRLEDEVAAFKRWAANAPDQNGKGRKLDWDKALWNWLGRVHDDKFARHQHRQQPASRNTAAVELAMRGLDPHATF